MESYNEMQQAVLLLTQPLVIGRQPQAAHQPLSGQELACLEEQLRGQEMTLPDLFNNLNAAPSPFTDRVCGLMERGFLLSMATVRWNEYGISPVFQTDPDYPLEGDGPPVVFRVGQPTQSCADYTGIIAPATRDRQAVAYAHKMGRAMANAGVSLVTGVGRPCEAGLVMEASKGGRIVAFARGPLSKAATDRRYRDGLMDGQLTVLSAADPIIGRPSSPAVDGMIRRLAKRVYRIQAGPPPSWQQDGG